MNIYRYRIPVHNYISIEISWKDLFIKSDSRPTNEQAILILKQLNKEEPTNWWDKCLDTFKSIKGPILEREKESKIPVVVDKTNCSIIIEKIRVVELK